jgi:pyocin large subunit-like protein
MQYRVGRAIAASVLFSVSIFGLTACGDGGSAALAARDHAAPGEFASASEARNSGGSEARLTSAPIRLSRAQPEGGDIAWASSRSASAAENAQARFERYGSEFDAVSPEAYAAKAQAFLRKPPKGVQTLERVNGDVLVYDAKTNVFAVANADGLPRTFFHPRDGATYWAQQKATESKRTASAGRSNADS